jgi:hypothetical protein
MYPPHLSKPTTRGPIRSALALSALGACLALAACGSSASSSTGTSSSTGASSKAPQGAGSGRFTALRSCLAKQGITLPAPSGNRPPAGSGTPGQGGGLGRLGGLQPPSGVSTTQFREALKKCAGGKFGGGRFNSAAGKAALTKFVACMRENGVNLPPPNTSGTGPVFNTKGINTSSAMFKSAESKCQGDLPGRLQGGAPNGGPPSGADGPPAGEGGTPPGSEPGPNA